MEKGDIVVVGSLNMDHVINCKRIPRNGETLKGDNFSYHPGGKGSNQACAVAKLGCKPIFIGARGEDRNGEELETKLLNDGVETDLILTRKSTGTAHIFVTENGESYIVIIPGANGEINKSDIEKRKEIIKAAKYILLQFEIPMETVIKTIELANTFNTSVILDPSPAQSLSRNILEKIDYLLPNKEELNQLTPNIKSSNLEEKANFLVSRGVKNVIVTKGKKGVNVFNKKGSFALEPPKVEAVDTTGAGDAFAGAFSVGLRQNLSLKKAVDFGINYAAATVTKPGAQSSYINKEEFYSLYSEAKKLIFDI